MDDEFQSSSIFGNYAAWQLGYWSAQNSHQEREAVAKITGLGPVSVRKYNQQVQVAKDWRSECLRLQQINASLVAQLNASNNHSAALTAWGEEAHTGKVYWKERAGQHKHQTQLMCARAQRFQDELERLKGNT